MKILFIVYTFSLLVIANTAPSFNAELIGGNRVSLADIIKKDKLLFLSFWSTWCTACIEELKKIKEHQLAHPELPLEIFTINVDTSETSSQIVPTLRAYKLNFPVALDPKHEIFEKYQKNKELPFSVLIDENFNILRTFKGYSENLFSEVNSLLKKK